MNEHGFLSEKQVGLLKSSIDDASFRREVLRQIAKDFESFNQTVELPETAGKDAVYPFVLNLLLSFRKTHPTLLRPLLYQIDIPENALALLPPNEEDSLKVLAEWIVLREAYKVYLRHRFSAG